MITSWGVSNFKSVRDGRDLVLAPLTIFAGANSSGKSAFIQSILLVAQTLSHKVGSRSVVLNGALTSLGQFDDLKSVGNESDQIVMRGTCRPVFDALGDASSRSRMAPHDGYRVGALREASFEVAFDADPSNTDRDVNQVQPRLFSIGMDCTLRDDDNVDQKYTLFVRHAGPDALARKLGMLDDRADSDEEFRAALLYDVTLDEMSMSEVREHAPSAQPFGCVLRHFLPVMIVHTTNAILEQARDITAALQHSRRVRSTGLAERPRRTRDVMLSGGVIGILRDVLRAEGIDIDAALARQAQQVSLFESDDAAIPLAVWDETLDLLSSEERARARQALLDAGSLSEMIEEALRKSAPSSDVTTEIDVFSPRQIGESALYIEEFFASSFKYLGPLRDAPLPLYPVAPSADPYDVGPKGEATASVLEQQKRRRIRYIPSAHFKSPSLQRRTVTATLEAAIVDWLQYLGIANSVQSKDMGKLGHELKVALANSDRMQDLTHVGVGVSQVLPILVECLLAEPDSTLVLEQPELYLHPRVQTLLGDFFLSMAMCGKQCIVETHSEYLIDRLRFQIAATESGGVSDTIKIYFVEKPGANSTFREVDINEYGAIVDWLDGFFDEAHRQAEEMLRAAVRKRKRAKDKGGV